MKRFIIYSVLVVILTVGGILLYAGMNASSLVAQYKPEIEKMASQALGTKVALGNLKTTIFPETEIVVDELLVGEKGSGETLSLKNLTVKVALAALLSNDSISLSFQSLIPRLQLNVRNQD